MAGPLRGSRGDSLEGAAGLVGPWTARRVSLNSRAKHVILTWRLSRAYFFYCLACFGATLCLLLWNLYKGFRDDWRLPGWKHHPWEEAMEVALALVAVEALLTMWMYSVIHGLWEYFRVCWHWLDLAVALLTVISVACALEKLGRSEPQERADAHLVLLRFVLLPARVVFLAWYTAQAKQIQRQVDELPVDFGTLGVCGPASAIQLQSQVDRLQEGRRSVLQDGRL